MGKPISRKKDIFWLSYSDLMTSLFFVMLVLFVLVYSMQRRVIQELLVAKEELERIREIEATVNNIDREYFTYDALHKKHILNIDFSYPTGSAEIDQIIPDKRPELLAAGKAIRQLIQHFPEEDNIKYLVVVEGQASRDNWAGNSVLSYFRAQSLINLWSTNQVGLDDLKNCELVVAGSGEGGIPRIQPDRPPANQRFLITIVPKIGEMNSKNFQ